MGPVFTLAQQMFDLRAETGRLINAVGSGRGLTGALSTTAIHRAARTAPLGDKATVGQHLHVIAGALAAHREHAGEHWAPRPSERRGLALGSASAPADSRTGSRRPAMSDQRAHNAANRHTTDHRQPRRRDAFWSHIDRVVRRGTRRRRATARHGRGENGDREGSGREPGNRTVPVAHSKSKARPTNHEAEGAAIARSRRIQNADLPELAAGRCGSSIYALLLRWRPPRSWGRVWSRADGHHRVGDPARRSWWIGLSSPTRRGICRARRDHVRAAVRSIQELPLARDPSFWGGAPGSWGTGDFELVSSGHAPRGWWADPS